MGEEYRKYIICTHKNATMKYAVLHNEYTLMREREEGRKSWASLVK